MSGWIKLEKDRRDDPRVLRMARALRDAAVTHERFMVHAHVTLVLGCLDQLWCYADTHVREDDTLDLGLDEIDELVGIKGFACLLPSDWLEVVDAQCVKLPSFHAHNGTESKRRALTQKRMERHRNAQASPPPSNMQRTSVTRASPDQTKTRPRPDQKNSAASPLPESLNTKAWAEWLAYRTERKLPKYRNASITKNVTFLAGYSETEQQTIIDSSIRNGYQGLFEPKANGSHAQRPPRRTRYEEVQEMIANVPTSD